MDQTQQTQKLLMDIARLMPNAEIGGVMNQLQEIHWTLKICSWALIFIAACLGGLAWRTW